MIGNLPYPTAHDSAPKTTLLAIVELTWGDDSDNFTNSIAHGQQLSKVKTASKCGH